MVVVWVVVMVLMVAVLFVVAVLVVVYVLSLFCLLLELKCSNLMIWSCVDVANMSSTVMFEAL